MQPTHRPAWPVVHHRGTSWVRRLPRRHGLMTFLPTPTGWPMDCICQVRPSGGYCPPPGTGPRRCVREAGAWWRGAKECTKMGKVSITEFPRKLLTWTPDGKSIVVAAGPRPGSRMARLMARACSGGEPNRLTMVPERSPARRSPVIFSGRPLSGVYPIAGYSY